MADEQTIDALKLISVRRGYDPRDFTLVAFGGGGPTHAAALLEELGARRIVIPPFPGTFSAWGMLHDRTTRRPGADPHSAAGHHGSQELERSSPQAEAEAIAALTAQGFAAESIPAPRRSLDMRYRGQEHTVDVAVEATISLDRARLTAAFHERHRRRYTFALEDTPVEIVNFRVTATATIARPTVGLTSPSRGGNPHKERAHCAFRARPEFPSLGTDVDAGL